MAFDEKTIAEIVRHRMGIPDGSMNVRITWAIPIALEQLARKVAANPRKRAMLLTEKSSTTLPVTTGLVDIETYNATAAKKILIEYLHVGNAWYVGVDVPDANVVQFPLHRIEAGQHIQNFANHPLAGEYIFYWMDGMKMRLLDLEISNPLEGDVQFATPYQPTLVHLAAIPELHGEFIEKMVELCAGPGNDTAEDGEH